MEYFCNAINCKEAYVPYVLPIKMNSSRRKLQNTDHENEIAITSTSLCNLFVNEHLHVDENKTVYALSDNFIKSYWSVQYD